MSSNTMDYIVYCRWFDRNTTLVVGRQTAEEFGDCFSSEDLVPLVGLSDPGHFALVPPVLVSLGRDGNESSRFGRRESRCDRESCIITRELDLFPPLALICTD